MKSNTQGITTAGHLRIVSSGIRFGLRLDRVQRVSLIDETTRLHPRPGTEAWWRGAALGEKGGLPVLGINALLGLSASPPGALVECRVGSGTLLLECDAVQGIVPDDTPAEALSAGWLMGAQKCFPRILHTPEHPVIEIDPEALIPARRRQTILNLMSELEPSIEKLWELSELEHKLAKNPSAKGYRELARQFAEQGWQEDSQRVANLAEEQARLETAKTATQETATATDSEDASASLHTGAFNPRVAIELLQVLHLTGKSGVLKLASPGGQTVEITLRLGQIIATQCADAGPGEPTLKRALGMEGGRYTFKQLEETKSGEGAITDTSAVIQRLAQTLA